MSQCRESLQFIPEIGTQYPGANTDSHTGHQFAILLKLHFYLRSDNCHQHLFELLALIVRKPVGTDDQGGLGAFP